MTLTTDLAYRPWSKQLDVHESEARFRVVIAGRQSGKSMTAVAEIAQWAMEDPNRVLWWLTANYEVKDKAWTDLTDHLPKDIIKKSLESQRLIVLGNNSRIHIKSADGKDSLVSAKLDALVCDEFCQWKESAWMQVRPMLNVTMGPVIFVGTPRGRNWGWKLWLRGQKLLPVGHPQQGQPNPDYDPSYASFHWRTSESPYSNPMEIEQARRDMHPDWFRQEYDAEIIDNAAAVFRNIAGCIRRMPAAPDQWMCLGVDLGRKMDRSCIVVMNGRREVVEILTTQVDWPVQKQMIAALAFKYQVRKITVDSTGAGDPIARDLAQAGFPVEEFVITGGGASKHQLIDGLRIAINQGNIAFPDHPDLIRELEAYEFEIKDEGRGRITYSAPPGEHDDMVVALGLALWGQRGLVYLPQRARGPENYLSRGRERGESYLNRPRAGISGVVR